MNGTPRVPADALRLIAVTDSLHGGIHELARRAAAAVEGGATMITLRLPGEAPRILADAARALRSATPGIPLLVSDRIDVALAVDADGVHVGADGLRAAVVRKFVPDGLIIGASLGGADDVGCVAGADFVAIGPVFPATMTPGDATSIGVEGFVELARACGLPAVAVGGVSPSNAGALVSAGAAGVAVISALFGANDPTHAARELRAALDASGR